MFNRKRIIIFAVILLAAAVILAVAAFVAVDKSAAHPAQPAGERPLAETVDRFPLDINTFNAAVSRNYPDILATSGPVIAGLVPHHDLADSLAAAFFSALAKKQAVKNFIVIGPLHSDVGLAPMVSGRFIWDAGFARVENNYQILDELASKNLIAYDENATRDEHSLYNMVPFIAHYFPGAKIVPIALTSHNNPADCFALAQALQKYLAGGDTVVIASIDFSHYLPSVDTAAKNAEMVRLIQDKDYYTIAGLKSDHLDSPASLNVLLKTGDLAGADFQLVDSSNSSDITGAPSLSSTSYITGFMAKDQVKAVTEPQSNLPPAASRALKLEFFGDIMLDRHVGDKIKTAGNMDFIFGQLQQAGVFSGNDLVSANLEGAVTDSGAHLPPSLSIDFAFAPALVGELKQYGFNYFNIANNHLSDQGEDGIIQTEKNLTDLGYDFSGCRDKQIGDCTAKIIERNGRKIGLTGASMVYGLLDEKALLAKVKDLASSTDLVISQMHWGTEYQHEPNKNQVNLAHELIDAGADMVIGHHPHVVEGIEIYKGKPIFYSLGNFVFDQYFSTDTQEELGVKMTTDGEDFQISLLPIKSESTNLRLMDDQEKAKFLSELAGWSIGDENLKKEISVGIINYK